MNTLFPPNWLFVCFSIHIVKNGSDLHSCYVFFLFPSLQRYYFTGLTVIDYGQTKEKPVNSGIISTVLSCPLDHRSRPPNMHVTVFLSETLHWQTLWPLVQTSNWRSLTQLKFCELQFRVDQSRKKINCCDEQYPQMTAVITLRFRSQLFPQWSYTSAHVYCTNLYTDQLPSESLGRTSEEERKRNNVRNSPHKLAIPLSNSTSSAVSRYP